MISTVGEQVLFQTNKVFTEVSDTQSKVLKQIDDVSM